MPQRARRKGERRDSPYFGICYLEFSLIVVFTKNRLLLYHLLKILARIALPFYCRKLVLNDPAKTASKGPLLLACSHPNSFLDSVILDTIFREPVWSLARGDVFKKPFYIKLLTSLKILPVYRI